MNFRLIAKTLLCYVGVHQWGVTFLGSTRKGNKIYQVYQCKKCGKEWKERI
jgi:hypothetical protein